MERRFFMNEFEQSLKEHADSFQMAPSKKVWHGIYNDLHPGKRWPSVTMSLLLIFTLVVIGHLNTNNSRRTFYTNIQAGLINKEATRTEKDAHKSGSQRIVVRKTDLDKGKELFVYTTGQSHSAVSAVPMPVLTDQVADKKEVTSPTGLVASNAKPAIPSIENTLSTVTQDERLQKDISFTGTVNAIALGTIAATHQGDLQNTPGLVSEKNTLNTAGQRDDKKLTENTTKQNNTSAKVALTHKKKNENIHWVYYGAPVVSTVSLSGTPLKPNTGANMAPGFPRPQANAKVLHNSALGAEAGVQMNYDISKKLQFTTGVHLTYSGYNVLTNIVHPFFATLVLRHPSSGITYLQSFMTHYGDGTGQAVVSIRNYSYQASIPLGLQYQLLGNDKLQFHIAANIEPSVLLKSRAYILSSDGNYINDPDIMRKLNFSSNFGTFITFSSNKFKWQIGPNLRYQWLSTYLKDYTVKEHLIDYGIRIGVSR
jgi:hypothetical protein